ncbi:hypothetical protein NQ317_019227 [Molorchus minor]|uniref:Uncharacterized protein n=1 Tax=Molorchus minor TaxID=1323400 RepID=A0ABQ9JSU4_9CUCU|nr:hypothetical protein NQ317_019227 [Molorchus minor]
METNLFLKWCRICYTEFTNGINLFGEESRRTFLHAKIRRYLSLTISLEDRLPKMICSDCCLKLDEFHKFATMAIRNQEKMSKLVFSNGIIPLEPRESEGKSLLHTYLTKGIKEKEQNKDLEVTEMEVRVDPMMILQCSLEDEDSNTDNSEEKSSDQSDPENGSLAENLSEIENYEKNKKTLLLFLVHSPYPKRILNSFNNVQELKSTAQLQEFELNDISVQDETITESDADTGEEDKQLNRFSCPICGKIISTKGNLKVHLETHRPKGRYGCDICGRIFKTQCNLYRHKEYHGGIQYPCAVCGRVYPTNSTLRAHSITHSDLRPHKCPLCDKTFKRNQDLKFHINQHTGARPYQCPYCPKAFASSGNCFSHRKRMHPIEVERDRERAAKIMR